MNRVGIDFGMENIKVSIISGKVIRSMDLEGAMGDVHVTPNVVYYTLNENNEIEQYFFGSQKAEAFEWLT